MTSRLPSLNGLRAFEAARAAHELHAGGVRTERDADRDQPSDPAARGRTRRPPVHPPEPLAEPDAGGCRIPSPASAPRSTTSGWRPTACCGGTTTTCSPSRRWHRSRPNGCCRGCRPSRRRIPGIDVRITTSTSLVDFQRDKVDAAIRYGRGQWAGLRADWLMADELFPVCSPSLLQGNKPLEIPRGPQGSRAAAHQQHQQRRLAAVADRGRPA